MKEIILTIDYELFLGNQTGSVQKCMIDPTNELAKVLDLNQSKMTVFWDILHFYRLLELEDKFTDIKEDRILIQNQILSLAKRGHDIQLHLHPHWLDAEYIEGNWKFVYERFKLHSLSSGNNADDIYSIFGCVSIAKNLIERIVRKVDENFRVFSFRAGGYLVEPFIEIKDALYKNGIYLDSSVCPELINESNIFSYNFKNYPNDNFYRFENNIINADSIGKFIEIPITSIRVPLFRRLYFTILKRIKYNKIESLKKGSGSESAIKKSKKKSNKIISFIKDKKFQKLTTDNSFDEKYSYLLKRAKNNSTQILHPKMLNFHSLNMLRLKISQNEVKFNSISNFMKIKENTKNLIKH